MEADRSSFEAYVRARTPALSRLAYLLTGDHHLAEDLVQQTFLRVAARWRRVVADGAWLPDGKRIALYTFDGCGGGDEFCDTAALGDRLFRVRYVDALTGQATSGPALAPARGLTVRMLGWQADGDAVVAVHEVEEGATKQAGFPEWEEDGWWTVGGVHLMEFRADGSQGELVELPEGALFVDVPASLLNSFGGPSASWLEGAFRRALAWRWPLGQFGILLGLLMLAYAGRRAVVWFKARQPGRE